VYVINRPSINLDRIQTSPRIGLETIPEPWRSMPWRFVLEDQKHY
jgi:3-methyladenine DNA glycosylase Mpg